MEFRFSQRSLNNLEGVEPKLQRIAHEAIKLTRIDFGITEGLRSIERQRQLVANGASQTMNSIHIIGRAIDVAAYIGPRVSWELPLYCCIADAFKAAAGSILKPGERMVWGAAWHIPNIVNWNGSMQDALDDYIDTRRSQGRRPFIDAPHFEIHLDNG